MKKIIFFLLLSKIVFAQQQTLTGIIKNKATNKVLQNVTVKIKKTNISTITNNKGEFVLDFNTKTKTTLHLSLLGFTEKEIDIVTASKKNLILYLEENITNLDKTIITVSKIPEKIFEAITTVEHLNAKDIENSTAPDFYDEIQNLKGVNLNTSSLTFKSYNTRGFTTFENNRFVQMIDGVDLISPGLGFSFGNTMGINQLDVASVAILPGTASALYGPNAFNGMLHIQSKSPYKYQGTQTYIKSGVTSSSNAGVNPFINAGFRYATKIANKSAFKITGAYIQGTDWKANDDRNIDTNGKIISGTRETESGYNGINLYGDEVATNLANVGFVSRTGYSEEELLENNTTYNFKTSASFHYKPYGAKKEDELIASAKLGTGTSTFHGGSRYYLKNYKTYQTHLEYKNKHITTRLYANFSDAGNGYDVRFAGINLNRAAKSDVNWFTDYSLAYQGTLLNPAFGGLFNTVAPEANNHAAARAFADNNYLNNNLLNATQIGALGSVISSITGGTVTNWSRSDSARFAYKSNAFSEALQNIKNNPDIASGAKFVNNSKIYHGDFKYSFKDQIEVIDVVAGTSLRSIVLDSDGTSFTDSTTENIQYNEFGIYTQAQKKLLNNRIKLTGALRYDKNSNFKGRLTPKISAMFLLNKQNIRISYQEGFRNPSSNEQYLGLDVASSIFAGTAKGNLDRNLPGTDLTIRDVLTEAGLETIKQEEITSFEIGYRTNFKKFNIDFSSYLNNYTNFIYINTATVNNEVFSLYTNTDKKVTSYGSDIGIKTNIFNNYNIGLNYSFAKLDLDNTQNDNFEARFNTPEHRVKLAIDNNNLYKGLGFGINARWQDAYQWESAFVDAKIKARYILDASLTYKIKKPESNIKIGGANLLQNEYVSAPGAGIVGAQYFGSWTLRF